MPLGQNPHQTVTRFGCVGFSMHACGFSVPKCDNFACLHTCQDQNELHLKRWFFFFAKIGNSWTNWTLYGVIPRSLCKIRLNDVSKMFNCWERRWIDVIWLFTLWFIDEDANFFHFLYKITYIRSLSSSKIPTQFSHTFWNITMIFKVMSQYIPALFKRIHNHIRLAEG